MSGSISNPSRFPILSYQPIRLVYQIVQYGTIVVRLPLWILRAAIPSLRPHPKWTYKQALMRDFLQALVHMTSAQGVTETLTLKPGREGPRYQVIEPFPDDVYVGPLLPTAGEANNKVRPTTTGGTWYGPAAAPTEAVARGWKKVALHLHGGAFVTGDGRPGSLDFLARSCLVEKAGFDAVLAPEYRLSGHAGRDPFPAALQDALTSYLYLVRTLGVPAAAVTVSGDSAGGNLAIALLRYLERLGPQLGIPAPGHVVLVSPWVAPLDGLRADVDYTRLPQWRTDIVPLSFVRWGATAYALQAGHDETSEWVQPRGRPFATGVPLFVTMGSAEILSVQGTEWCDEMRKLEGNELVVNYEENAPHDTLLVGGLTGWDASAFDVARKIGDFVDGN